MRCSATYTKGRKSGKRCELDAVDGGMCATHMHWALQYRLNICNREHCGHYLHAHGKDGKCSAGGCACLMPMGREYQPKSKANNAWRIKQERRNNEGIVSFV
jgi:hypothetical protein